MTARGFRLLALLVAMLCPLMASAMPTTLALQQRGEDLRNRFQFDLDRRLHSLQAGDRLQFEGAALRNSSFEVLRSTVSPLGNRVLWGTADGAGNIVIVQDEAGNTRGRILDGKERWSLTGQDGAVVAARSAVGGVSRRFDAAPRRPTTRAYGSITDETAANSARRAEAAVAGSARVDVLIYADSDLVSPSLLAEELIAVANTAYAQSNAEVQFRVVGLNIVDIDDEPDAGDILDLMDFERAPFANIASERDAVGADVVMTLRGEPSNASDTCGIAYISVYHGRYYPVNPFGVVHYDPADGFGLFCSDYTMAHELGHTLGAHHDIDTIIESEGSADYGAFRYSLGYGVNGVFGTIMSYIDPEQPYLSSPDLSCRGQPCGIAPGEDGEADNVTTFNITAPNVSEWRAEVPQAPDVLVNLNLIQPGVVCKAASPTRNTVLQSQKTGLTNTSTDQSFDVVCPIQLAWPDAVATDEGYGVDVRLRAQNDGASRVGLRCSLTEREGSVVIDSTLVTTLNMSPGAGGSIIWEGFGIYSPLSTFVLECSLPPGGSLTFVEVKLAN